jgi:tetratricopeptide (TPR) repeat protein
MFKGLNVFYIITGLMIICCLFLFLRYVFGYFMRNFERQADLYGASLVGPDAMISALEKIAYLSGKVRDIPSWHHYSIKERVETLEAFKNNPSIIKKHNRKVRLSIASYVVAMILIFVVSIENDFRGMAVIEFYERELMKEASKEDSDPRILLALAQIALEKNDYKKARAYYEQVLQEMPDEAIALNNLAWLLLTSDDSSAQDYERAFEMAKRAVELERNPVYLDTLAEAYYKRGDRENAIKVQKEAVELSKGSRDEKTLLERLKKFQEGPRVHERVKEPFS